MGHLCLWHEYVPHWEVSILLSKIVAVLVSALALVIMGCGESIPQTPDELAEAVRKELRPHKNIEVKVQEHHEGGSWYVEAEYQPLVRDTSSIEQKMMETYRAIYTAEVPVWRAVIIASTELVDIYGNGSVGPIYRTEMDVAIANRINWDEVYQVNPSRVMDTIYKHRELQ